MNIVVALVALTTTCLVVPESRDPRPRRIDLIGALLSTLGLLGVTYGIIASSEHGIGRLDSAGSIAAGLILFALFWLRSRRCSDGMFDLTIARTHTFQGAALAAAAMMFVMTGLLFILTQQIQLIQGFSTLLTGVAILPMAGAAVVSSMTAPALAARTSARASITLGLLLFAGAAAGYAITQPITGYLPLLAVLILIGLGVGFVAAVTNDVLMSYGPRHRSGLISSMNDTVQEVGSALGIAILGAVLAGSYATTLGTTAPSAPSSSLAATLQTAHGDPELIARAAAAFGDASRTAGIAAAIALVTAAVVPVILRRRRADAAQTSEAGSRP